MKRLIAAPISLAAVIATLILIRPSNGPGAVGHGGRATGPAAQSVGTRSANAALGTHPSSSATANPPSSTAASSVARGATPAPGDGAAPWFTVSLASECVSPGQTQTVDVQSRPRYVVAYNATYSDGKGGTTYGGAGYSPTNSDGTYRSTWVVSPQAPLGLVKLAVGTQEGNARPVTRQATFTVAAHC